jgi:hypothetical protein
MNTTLYERAQSHLAEAARLFAEAVTDEPGAGNNTEDEAVREHLSRVEKLGPVAHAHLAFLETHDNRMTLQDSRVIRRQLYGRGDQMRATANLFGRKDERAILYRDVAYGTKLNPTKQQVFLTEEGERIARAYRRLHGLDDDAPS